MNSSFSRIAFSAGLAVFTGMLLVSPVWATVLPFTGATFSPDPALNPEANVMTNTTILTSYTTSAGAVTDLSRATSANGVFDVNNGEVRNTWGSTGIEINGVGAFLNLDVTTGGLGAGALDDTTQIDVGSTGSGRANFFFSQMISTGAAGTANDFFLVENGGNDMIDIVPLDASGAPIGNFSLTIEHDPEGASDWGQLTALYDRVGDGVGPTATPPPIGGVAFDLEDFMDGGTPFAGTLSGIGISGDAGLDALVIGVNSTLAPVAEPVLHVHRETGAISLENAGDADLQILGYSITSAAGALRSDHWNPISGTRDVDGDQSVDLDDAWQILTSPGGVGDLSEFSFGGDGGVVAAGATLSLSDVDGAWLPWTVEDDLRVEIAVLDQGTMTIPIVYDGNSQSPLLRSDLNSDGSITVADWVILNANGLSDFSLLSQAQQYAAGDLNLDGENDLDDYAMFISDFDDFNGPGAFVAMLQSVPEPSSLLLCGLGGLGAMTFRRRRSCHHANDDSTCRSTVGSSSISQHQRSSQKEMFHARTLSLLLVGLAAAISLHASSASAQTHVLDPFTDGDRTNGADLQDFAWYTHNADTTLSVVDDTGGIGTGNALNVDNTNQHDRIVAGFSDVTLGPNLGDQLALSFDVRITDTGGSATGLETGFRFGLYHDDGTPTTADEQGNALDGDDDGYRMTFGVGSGNARTFVQVEAGLGTDAILSGSDRETLYNLENGATSAHIGDADSHSVRMTITRVAGGVEIDGFLDGVSVLDAPAFDDNDNLGPYTVSGDLTLPVIETFNEVAFGDSTGSGSVTDFILDNVRVYVPELLLTAMVQPNTGEVFLVNSSSETVEFNGYELKSVGSPTLDSDNWNSLQDQNIDPVGGGDDPGETWTEVGGSSSTALGEQFFLGSTTLASGESLSIGQAFDTGVDGDFTLRFYNVLTGSNESGGEETILVGDMDGNGAVEEADINAFVLALTDRASYEATYNSVLLSADAMGDFNGNGQLDLGDISGFKALFAGPGASANPVPEPSAFALILLSSLAVLGRKGRSQNAHWGKGN